jgi:hypothetical protein
MATPNWIHYPMRWNKSFTQAKERWVSCDFVVFIERLISKCLCSTYNDIFLNEYHQYGINDFYIKKGQMMICPFITLTWITSK